MNSDKEIAVHKLANAAAARASVNACNRILNALEQELRAAGVKGPEILDALALLRSSISTRDDEADQQFYDLLGDVTEKRGNYAGTQR